MKYYKLYVHINKINNKKYFGITCQNINERWRNGKGYGNNNYFTNAINKYGWNNFIHEILFDNLNKEEACLLEQCYIALYDTTDRDKGYNITLGGEGVIGYIPSNETRQKISENHVDNSGEKHPMYGKHHTEEAKKKISKATKGENNPMYGKKGILSPNYGKSFTEEHKKKISESHKGKNNYNSKSVYVIELDMTFDTLTECAKYLNCTINNISNALRGKSKTAKGYHITYTK